MTDEERNEETGGIFSGEARKATEGMMDVMGPAMVATQLLDAEGRAWDLYVSEMLPLDSYATPLDDATAAIIVGNADKLLAARRERFNELVMAERLRALSPSAAGMCNKPVSVKGRDIGSRCVRRPGHDGHCY